MKKISLLLLALSLHCLLYASSLVMIRVAGPHDLRSVNEMQHFTINYIGNGFVVGTSEEETRPGQILLDRDAWQPGNTYFIAFANISTCSSYRQEMTSQATILYQTDDLFIFRAGEYQLKTIMPPVAGSLARLWNRPAALSAAPPHQSDMLLTQDPFIVARMAEVNTTLIQANVQQLQNYGTRRCTKPEAILAQNWIKGVFESYGLPAQLFDFTMPQGSVSDNVIATKTGTLFPNEYVIIGGHYDSYAGGTSEPGADDNASGTCGVLEVARILSQYTFDRTIIFCAFSGEEYGLYGSEAYAAWCDAQNMNILGYLNMDMIGYLTPGDAIHTDIIAPASAQWLVNFYTGVVNTYLPAFTTAPGALSGGDSDHTSFNNHGFMGIFPFEDSQNYSPYIHTSNDIIGPSVNNFEQVGVFTKAMVATTISLANMPPPPDPADISVTPLQFNKTITVGESTSDLLLISNEGESPLTYTAQVLYAGGGSSPDSVFALNASYNTGSTTNSAKTQTSLVKGYPTTEAGWMKFNISGIPDGATITGVEFHGYVYATNYPYWNITPVTVDPLSATPAALYADITAEATSGYYLYRSESSSYTTGWKTHVLGGNANANLQSALTQDWFAIGIMDRDNSSSYYIGFHGWNESNKPYLVVTYNYTPPFTWLTINGASTVTGTLQPANNQQYTVGFSPGSLGAGTYSGSIRVSSNDPDEPQVMVACTMNVTPAPLTRSWTGAIDENWNNPGNWNPEGVPGLPDDVVIPAGAANMPVVSTNGLGCNNILVQAGATLAVPQGINLTVNGTVTIQQ